MSSAFAVEKSGLVYDAAGAIPSERIAFVCDLYTAPSGSIFAGFQLASAKSAPDSHIGLMRSRDGGRTWQRLATKLSTSFQDVPGSLAGADLMEAAAGRLILVSTWYDRSDLERPLFDPVTEGLLKSKMLKAFSDDDGETWTEWEEIPLHGLTGTAVSGGMLRWADGSIGISFESFKHYDEVEHRVHASWILRSFDEGCTFPDLSQVTTDPSGRFFYWDQRLCPGAGIGEYFGLFWTHDREAKTDLPVHWKHGRCGEKGQPSAPQSTGIPGQISALLRLEDGSQLACVVNRNSPAGLTLFCSQDEGRTWPRESSLVIYNHEEKAHLSQRATDIDFAQYWEDMGRWTFGHPAMCELEPGRVLLIYYAGVPGELSVHWSIIRRTKS